MFGWMHVFTEGVEWSFIGEILFRTAFMFLLVLLVLRLSGKQGVRQLTLFEVAIILSLGSAAGDPMFQEGLPLLYAIAVFAVVLLLYKVIAWASAEYEAVHHIMEGSPSVIIRDGQFVLNERGRLRFPRREFHSEIRNQSVEHLGQVRLGVLEVDGTLSLLLYDEGEEQVGLPLFPDQFKKTDVVFKYVQYACMYCGYTTELLDHQQACVRCHHREWTTALSKQKQDQN